MAKKLISYDDEAEGLGLPAPVEGRITANMEDQATLHDTQVKVARPRPEPDDTFVLIPGPGHDVTTSPAGTGQFLLSSNGGPVSRYFFRFSSHISVGKKRMIVPASGMNLARKALRVRLRIAQTDTTLRVYAGDATLENAYVWHVQNRMDDPALKFLQPGSDWDTLNLAFDSAQKIGTPTRTALDFVHIEMESTVGSTAYVDVGSISTIRQDTPGIVSMTFDDGYEHIHWRVAPIMDAHGLKGTAYIIPDSSDKPNFMTLPQINSLQDRGWDISAHHLDDLSVLSDNDLDATLAETKAWFIKHGFRGADHFAYPMGRFSSQQAPIWERYFATCRTTVSATQETVRPADPMRLRNFYIHRDTTVDEVKAAITRAVDEGTWLILCFHNIVPTPTAATHWALASFEEICAWMDTNMITVRTVSEATRVAAY